MNILAIECTHEALSVAVSRSGAVTKASSADWKKAAESLVPLLDEVMQKSALERKALDAVAISSGPGSFTALRIGMSVAKGVAYGLGIPLLPVPTMPAMAASLGARDGAVMAVIQSRKGEYYYADYSATELAAGVWHNDVMRGSLDDVMVAATQGSGGRVVVARHIEPLRLPLVTFSTHYAEADFFSASSLFLAAEKLFVQATTSSLGEIMPDYRQGFTPNGG